MNINFRPIQPDDQAFLREVYASTRIDELKATDWDENQKSRFIDMQFAAQHQHYQENYHDTDFLVILRDSQAIGRLYIARWPNEIRIVDITILSEFRNLGIGSGLLRAILDEAALVDKPVCIHVEQFNPALNLYYRLGFTKKNEQGVYWLMEWSKRMENGK